MRYRRTTRFRSLFEQLPTEVQQSARRAYVLFQRDPAHPSLQFKRLRANRQTYSIRVGLGYRALGIRFDENLGEVLDRSSRGIRPLDFTTELMPPTLKTLFS